MILIIIKILLLFYILFEGMVNWMSNYPIVYRIFIRYRLIKQLNTILSNYSNGYQYYIIKDIDFFFLKREKIYIEIKNILIEKDVNYFNFFIITNFYGEIKNIESFIEKLNNMDDFYLSYNKNLKEKIIIEKREDKLKKLGL